MDAARWERVQALFHDAADLPESEQREFLEARCGGDAALRDEVLELLAEERRTASPLDAGVASFAHRLLEETPPYDRFGPYRIRSVLGRGGMGVVYLAERSDLGSLAAIKILRDAGLSPARRERFALEQRTLAQLGHPAIARILDADVLPDGTPWFAMEYVEGEPLAAHCHARALSVRERLAIFRDVCEAVQHAHGHAVIHRDLKPSNILVTAGGAVKLLDYGISKQLESLDLPVDPTQTGLKLMTPAYAAPEQLRGGQVGTFTDVYSLGVVLYELLAGRLPFDLTRMTPGEIETAILERAPEKPSALARAVAERTGANSWVRTASRAEWADLDVLCLTAMHKEPERRYRTVDALVRDLDLFREGEPLEARPDGARYRFGKFLRRRRRAVAIGAAAAAAVVGLTVFYTARLAAARNAALAEAARTQRIQSFTLHLFQGGDEVAGPAESLRVVSLIDRGVQEARSLDAEPALQAEMLATLGGISRELGNLARADTLLGASLEKRRALFGRGSAETTESLASLAILRVDQAEYEEAERLVREALDGARETLAPDHPAVAHATSTLSMVLTERGDYDAAIDAGQDAVRLYSTHGGAPTTELSDAMAQLSGAHFYAGNYDTADSLNARILAMNRALFGEKHPRVAQVLINLGASQFDRGRYEAAEGFDREGLEILRAYYGEEHSETAYALTMLGRALVFQEKFDEGIDALDRALVVRERVFGADHPQVASTLNEMGNAALAQGSLERAEASFLRIVDIYRKSYGDSHYLNGIAMSNLASVYVQRKQYDRAVELYRRSIEQYDGTLPPDHVNVGIARIKLGRALLRQGRFREAAAETFAGYEIVRAQADPAVSFLRAAREDLAAAHDSLGESEKAARFREELAEAAAAAGGS